MHRQNLTRKLQRILKAHNGSTQNITAINKKITLKKKIHLKD